MFFDKAIVNPHTFGRDKINRRFTRIFALLHSFTTRPLHLLRFPACITSTYILVLTGEESVKKILTDGKHTVRELGKSEVNF